ncbi:MAG: tetratricopeptide repeat protein [Planctomycetota bacterium]|jgi:tetratricopeptide (TPR) repeat protein
MSKEIDSTPAGTAGPRRTTWAALAPAAVIVLAGAAAYHNSFRGPLVFDDTPSITLNPTIRSLARIGQVLSPPRSGEAVTGRPLVNLSLAINYAISALEVWSYHVFNLAVHILAGLALYGAVRRTLLAPALRDRFGRAATPLALAVALIWTVHPLQTESVTYIVQRAESIVGLFYLLTLYCVIRGCVSSRPALWHIPAILACLLGMASKEVMVSAPLIVLLYDRTFLAGSFKRALRRRWGLYVGLAATWALLAMLVIQAAGRGGTAGFGIGVSPGLYLLNQFRWIARYLRLSFWPYPLVLDYGAELPWTAANVWPHAILVVVLGAATVWGIWRRPKVGFLGAWFFAMLAPTSSVVPVATQAAAEHRMYLALAGVVGLSVMGAYGVWQRLAPRLSGLRARYLPQLVPAIAVAIIAAALGLRTVVRNRDYRSGPAIWQAAVREWPSNPRAYLNLGNELRDQDNLDAAIERYRQALRIDPDYYRAHNNLGIALTKKGKLDEAIRHYRRGLQAKPDEADIYYNLGHALRRQGKLDEAIRSYRQAVRLKPDDIDTHVRLAEVLAGAGSLEEAVGHYEEAIRLKPDAVALLNNLAWLLTTEPSLAGRDPAEAVRLAEKACELTRRSQPALLDTLAAAYAAAGRFDEAITTAKEAIDLANASGQAQLAREIQERLRLYRDGKPYRRQRPPASTRAATFSPTTSSS